MRVRLSISAMYRTSFCSARKCVSGVFVMDPGTTEEQMLKYMIKSVKARVKDTGHDVIGDLDVREFEVEYL